MKRGWNLPLEKVAEKLLGKPDYQFYWGDNPRMQFRSLNCPDMRLKRRSRLKIKICMIIHRLKQFFKRGMN
jgi:hypothetical protein